ncbi:type VI-B CRISPR-associated RNA-guided ribonuclease Cas13b [Flavobacterium croceum]|uniref:type VI-B CRISPR-associated RNA-guided ribonuclease Cas13b n=1 Tax=Flavobacterium croceum TaxID=370975 RepID=UPI0024A8068F|nr:type VI-B CRISPR-associated RNA-guided ribonuclease Cas13b [Flavobacterium croceum]
METKKLNIKTIQDNPEYFGSYLNMARHNVFLLINHLHKTFKYLPFQELKNDQHIATIENNILLNIFDTSKKEFEDERQKVYNYLIKRHHLPIIKYIGKNEENDLIDFEEIHKFLVIAFKELNKLRNSYTHYLAIDNNKNVLKRKLDINHELKKNIEKLFKVAPYISYLRNFETQKQEDYSHLLSNYQLFKNEDILTEHGFYFFINLFIERKYAIKLLKKIRGFKNETTPAFKSTLQTFTSYCLKIPDTRLDNGFPKQTILMEILSELNKCPKELYNHLTQNDKEKFEPKIKEEQIINSDNYLDIDNESIDSLVKDLVSLKRYEDRFPNFALRFIDEANFFDRIRFQITIGKLVIKRYNKTIIGNQQDRRVIKIINAYGKLNDFIGKETEILNQLKKDLDDDTIVFEQFAPHYNTNNNKIAFKIFDTNSIKIQYPKVFENKKEIEALHNNPSGFISIHDLHKIVLASLLTQNTKHSKNVATETIIIDFVNNTNATILDIDRLQSIKNDVQFEPENFTKRVFDEKKMRVRGSRKPQFVTKQTEAKLLLKYKLHSQELYSLSRDEFKKIAKNNAIDLEVFNQIKYKYYLESRKKTLQSGLPKNILVNQLPQRVLNHLMNISETSTQTRIYLKIKAIKQENVNLLKTAKKELKDGQIIKLGEYAMYLCRDILNMIIDKDLKQKITQPYIKKIQNRLSYFSISKVELVAILKELQLFDKNKGHVFLEQSHISNSKGIKDFYIKYLEEKNSWLNFFLNQLKDEHYNKQRIPYTYQGIINKYEDFNFTKWLSNKTKMPVNIPNSLLDNFVNTALKIKLKKQNIAYNNHDTLSVLIAKIMNKDTQPFYNYERVYKDKSKNSIHIKQINSLCNKTIKIEYNKFVEANEKRIRFYQTKDRVLKLMCNYLMKEDKTVGLENEILLKNIYPNSTTTILENPAFFKQKLRKNDMDDTQMSKSNENLYFTIIAQDNLKQIEEIQKWNTLTPNEKLKWTSLKTKEEQQSFLQNCNAEEIKIYHGQKGYQWKFKDYGRFKRFVKDRRLNELSKYFEMNEIPFDILEYQIMEFDKIREKIFEHIFTLEKAIYEKDPQGLIKLEFKHRPKEFNEVKFDVYLDWLSQNNLCFNKYIIKWGRNKFSHTEFPYFNTIPKITKKQIEDFDYFKNVYGGKEQLNISIAQKIIELFEKEITQIIEKIK